MMYSLIEGLGFGIIYSSYGDHYPTYNTLNGCIINGVLYGDTSVNRNK